MVNNMGSLSTQKMIHAYISYTFLLRVSEPMGPLVWFNCSKSGSVTRGLELVSSTKEVNRCCYAVKVLCMMTSVL